MHAADPLVPATYDLIWSGLVVVSLGLAVWAMVSLARRAGGLSVPIVLVWALVILLAPILGPIAWLAAGRRAGRHLSRT